MLRVPPGVRAHLERLVRLRMADRDPDAHVARLPDALEEGVVTRVVSGGPFGWLLDARLDRTPRGVELEVLEDSRMAGPDHYRVAEDGTVEALAQPWTMVAYPKDCSPEERERIDARYREHNAEVGEVLRRRGFLA